MNNLKIYCSSLPIWSYLGQKFSDGDL